MIVVVAFVALYVAVGRVDADDAHGWLARVVAGMHVLRSPRRLAAASAALVGVWLIDLAVIDLVFYAIGVDVPLGAGLIVLFGLNLAVALPSTPAQLGALEVGALAGCKLLGIADAPALAFALIYHAIMVVPTLAAGLALEHRLVLGRHGRARSTMRNSTRRSLARSKSVFSGGCSATPDRADRPSAGAPHARR